MIAKKSNVVNRNNYERLIEEKLKSIIDMAEPWYEFNIKKPRKGLYNSKISRILRSNKKGN